MSIDRLRHCIASASPPLAEIIRLTDSEEIRQLALNVARELRNAYSETECLR